jgi:RNA polymerase sigma-70 factor (ECF subfamily)
MSKVSRADRRPAAALASDMETVSLGPTYELPLPESFDDFYRRTFVGLLVLARALVGSSAEDVAQEAMLVAYRKWGEVGAMASPVAWVRRVCLNKAVSSLRRSSIERKLLHRSTAAVTVAEHADGVAGAEHFWSLVRQLPARQAEAVALRYAVDLSIVEVAEAMGCAEGTVKAHLARAKGSLAELVGAEDGGRS